jgi:hypothetical protein
VGQLPSAGTLSARGKPYFAALWWLCALCVFFGGGVQMLVRMWMPARAWGAVCCGLGCMCCGSGSEAGGAARARKVWC